MFLASSLLPLKLACSFLSFFTQSLLYSSSLPSVLSVSISAPIHMDFNVTSRWPPGSQSDGRGSCTELLEAVAPEATPVMEVSRNHGDSETNGYMSLQKAFLTLFQGNSYDASKDPQLNRIILILLKCCFLLTRLFLLHGP